MSVFVAGPLLLVFLGWCYSIWRTGGDVQDWYFTGYEFIYLLWPLGSGDQIFFADCAAGMFVSLARLSGAFRSGEKKTSSTRGSMDSDCGSPRCWGMGMDAWSWLRQRVPELWIRGRVFFCDLVALGSNRRLDDLGRYRLADACFNN
ncbi:MAG TPA: hypothetical protein VN957_26495 [Chthoniobacterales bacterium]|nr:hypothetical protein [Chthoniobacterales bacterium]